MDGGDRGWSIRRDMEGQGSSLHICSARKLMHTERVDGAYSGGQMLAG